MSLALDIRTRLMFSTYYKKHQREYSAVLKWTCFVVCSFLRNSKYEKYKVRQELKNMKCFVKFSDHLVR